MVLGFTQRFPDGRETLLEQKILSGEKIHSLRLGDRWQAGYAIHMATGVRTKKYRQFKIDTCKSVQGVVMKLRDNGVFLNTLIIAVDGRILSGQQARQLMRNDGLDPIDFTNWFFPDGPGEWSGQIIHWTDFKY